MDLLVVGGSGLLGGEIVRQSGAHATFHRAAPETENRHRLDLRDRAAVLDLVRHLRPRVIINAAYRQHDWAITADGAMHVAAAAAHIGARLVHVSSDAIFSGNAVTYDERSVPDPTTPYGAAKAAAELAVRGLVPDAVIARTSLIIGEGEVSHIRNVQQKVLFTDDVRCPIHVTDLAAALLELRNAQGVHHIAGPDAINRLELATLIARRDGLDETALTPGRRAETGPPGPLALRLDCAWTQERLTVRLRGAREFLARPDPAPRTDGDTTPR
ncbi:sugar nucleotide-binding protein [Catenuloplanes japonicus]|uniref:sugar nucleotide-binding protein n=1 Tax=Catenuloplanes japonicus TaxID=33876 RepID=UPI000524AD2A|nr:sugar nucleotide-binding protein [Catenuloplanes japonicus]